MVRVGLRELRQRASAVIAGVEGGDEVVVTVQNRDVALLAPIPRSPWVSRDIAMTVYDVEVDGAWRDEVADDRRAERRPADPWSSAGEEA